MEEKQKRAKEGPFVYVPDGARVNISNQPDIPPEPKYEKRRQTFFVGLVKKLVGGKYGRDS